MRILNFVFNAEIKYQQHINSENINTEIFGLTATLEKPTRGKPVREGVFIIWELQRNSVTAYSSSEI
jgi:hypothetical protein